MLGYTCCFSLNFSLPFSTLLSSPIMACTDTVMLFFSFFWSLPKYTLQCVLHSKIYSIPKTTHLPSFQTLPCTLHSQTKFTFHHYMKLDHFNYMVRREKSKFIHFQLTREHLILPKIFLFLQGNGC